MTKSRFKEFLLAKHSLEYFSPDISWNLICDSYSYDFLKAREEQNWTGEKREIEEGTHHDLNNKEKQERFSKLIKNKFDVLEKSIRDIGYGFWVDTDTIFLNEFNWFPQPEVDVVLSPHYMGPNPILNHVGLYNVGMVYVASMEFLSVWKALTNTGIYFYEQKPVEILAKSGKFFVDSFGPEYNYGTFRRKNPDVKDDFVNLNIQHRRIHYKNEKLLNFHVHSLDKIRGPAELDPSDKDFVYFKKLLRDAENLHYDNILAEIDEMNIDE